MLARIAKHSCDVFGLMSRRNTPTLLCGPLSYITSVVLEICIIRSQLMRVSVSLQKIFLKIYDSYEKTKKPNKTRLTDTMLKITTSEREKKKEEKTRTRPYACVAPPLGVVGRNELFQLFQLRLRRQPQIT